MLRFRQKKIIAVFVLLSLSLNSFAESGFKEKTSTNLVELFKVKAHATDHIKGIEAKLLATNEVDQEELLVELAQSLLYYQERHNKEPDSKVAASKVGRSLSVNGTSDVVSKVVFSKEPYSSYKIYHKALNAYKKAAKLSLNKSRIKYTRKLSELTVKLQKKDELVQIFDALLQHAGDESGTYIAHVDYADGLAKLKDDGAETQFVSAVNMRTPVDGVEAHYRYAKYLLKNDKTLEALSILDKFTFEERRTYVHIAMLRQKMMHQLKMDTQEVDSEIEQLRKNLSNSPFIGAIPKNRTVAMKTSSNILLGLPTAYAFAFAHNNEKDDSRGKNRKSWVKTPDGRVFSPAFINMAEVIYNEARGDIEQGRYAVAWAIRNRATIDMNGCDPYPGSEGHSIVNICRKALASGPITQKLHYDLYGQYSCAVHGGTINAGTSHSEMNDAHVDIVNLEASGVLWEALQVVNGWVADPTGPYPFNLVNYPDYNTTTGNPNGAQEWRRKNYCADNYTCKIRLGNVAGTAQDPGNTCSSKSRNVNNVDNFFWGRMQYNVVLNFIKDKL